MSRDNHEVGAASISALKATTGIDDLEAKKAAELIQVSDYRHQWRPRADDARRTFRGHRTRRELKGFGLDASTRFTEAVRDAQFEEEIQSPIRAESQPQPHARNATASPARAKWNHVLNVAKRAAKDDDSTSSDTETENNDAQALSPEQRAELRRRRQEARELGRKQAKMMELQYWLEFVDTKHRHGSNLRKYHAHWKNADTRENFFYWLDEGAGKDLELEECSRERLQNQQVRYLSRQERQHYLVQVNEQGLLIWAKNGERVWTKDELYKDSMRGIVPSNDPTPAFQHNIAPEQPSSESSWSSSEEDQDDSDSDEDEHSLTTAPDEGENYINEDFHRARGPAKLKYVSAGVVFNHMIRKSLQKGHKWIFVADTSLRLYIGYKQTGAFQHSSFMHGSRILAAGQIKVKDGQLRRLSPLSGHYRVPAANFRIFIKSLKTLGVDLSHLNISRSYAVLVGIEGYTKSRKKIKKAEAEVVHRKNLILDPEKAKEEEEKKLDSSKSAAREREILEQQQLAEAKAAREAKLTRRSSRKKSMSHFLERLGLRPRSSGGGGSSIVSKERRTGPEDGIPPPEGPLLR